jgi:cytidine deaminase
MMHEDSIMQKWEGREAADQPKLIFEPFVGVGARSFVNLFSVSLGIGRKLKRKSKDGYVLQWDGKTAQPRLPMYGQSYHELEQQIEQLLKDQN